VPERLENAAAPLDVTEPVHTGGMAGRTNVIMLTLASRSSGVVTRTELLEHGLSSATIAARAQQGFLMVVWPGLYEVPELTGEKTSLFRAVKSVPDSAIADVSAGRVWQAPLPTPDVDEPIHIVAPRDGPRTQMPGVIVHRTRRPFVEDIRFPVPGLPTLSPARTVLDLAGCSQIGDHRLAHIVESQLIAGVLDRSEIIRLLERPGLRGVSGARRLRSITETLLDDQPVADSMLERRFERLLVDHSIVGFRRQVRPPWYDGRRGVVDFADSSAKLVVEVDGRRWHATSRAMTEDRRRDRLAATRGWQVLRVTWSDVVDEPTRTAHQVAKTVDARQRAFDRSERPGAA